MEKRLRRLRINPTARGLVQENHLVAFDLIYPLFVVDGVRVRREIPSMPGIYHFSIDELEEEVQELNQIGVQAVLLFGVTGDKDEKGSAAYDDSGLVQRAVEAIKERVPTMYVITDVCLCQYTTHGHCGILDGELICNDPTVEALARVALSHARAGADMVAPSDMMDLRVRAIRQVLDDNDFEYVPIMSYAAKYASCFYTPFRDAAQSRPEFGDRKSHQLNPANQREALREVEADIDEGADVIMIKPAMCYLDIVSQVRERHNIPLAVYNVSGEYSMIKAAAACGCIDEARAVWEMLISMKRAGADLIVTYFARDCLGGKLRYQF